MAAAIADAADFRLAKLKSDPSLQYAFWLLTSIAIASREGDFTEQLERIGLRVNQSGAMLSLISDLSDKVRQRTTANLTSGDFAEISSLALRSALVETVAVQSTSLFGTSVLDLQTALRAYSSPERFGVVAERFFGEFFSRTLRSALDREIANHLGTAGSIRGIAESEDFRDALGLYARQSARIMQRFAVDWYSLHKWRSDHRISQSESNGFVAHALDKFRDDLREGKTL